MNFEGFNVKLRSARSRAHSRHEGCREIVPTVELSSTFGTLQQIGKSGFLFFPIQRMPNGWQKGSHPTPDSTCFAGFRARFGKL